MINILIAGFQHETNTFAPIKTTMAEFEKSDSWPGLLLGSAVISGTKKTSLPLAGFVAEAQKDEKIQLLPTVWASAEPAAHVTTEAFETITNIILESVSKRSNLHGIYLDLHGAMVTELYQDGEGEILRRLRNIVGPDFPISVSLDLHANLTQEMVDHATSITIFRSYPHLDMAETGARAFHSLLHFIKGGQIFSAFRQAPFLIPVHAQHTSVTPFKEVYSSVVEIGPAPLCWAEFAAGFPPADIYDAGPSFLVYSQTPEAAKDIADQLLEKLISFESQLDMRLLQPNDAIAEAKRISFAKGKPVVIADVQDNPGGGGMSDTTGVLHALISESAQGVILGMLNDPRAAKEAHHHGVHGEFNCTLGGEYGPSSPPFSGRFKVENLSNGCFKFGGEMYAGIVADTGPTAVLRLLDCSADICVVVSSKRCQCLDKAIFTHVGINPSEKKIIVVKSTIHFRADFEPISARILNAVAPGHLPCQLENVTYRYLRPGVRIAKGIS